MKIECIICLENKQYICITSCNHHICVDCLFRLKDTICPMCRKNLSDELPSKVKNNIIERNLLENTNKRLDTSVIAINDEYEFPPL